MLVLDPVSAPRWRVDCSRCSFLVYLPQDLHSAKVSKDKCEVGLKEEVERGVGRKGAGACACKGDCLKLHHKM
jgi:hypothetical protein